MKMTVTQNKSDVINAQKEVTSLHLVPKGTRVPNLLINLVSLCFLRTV